MTKYATRALFSIILLASTQALSNNLRTAKGGELVHWRQNRIEIVLDPSLGELGPLAEVEVAIIESFETWTKQGHLAVRFEFVQGNCGPPGYQMDGDNENCVMASSSDSLWHRVDRSDPGASSLVSYKESDGIILDGDIIFNVQDWLWSTDGEVEGTLSIRDVAIHEVGHLMGLAHSEINAAVMYPTTHLGPSMFNRLHADDVAALTTLYRDVEFVPPAKRTEWYGIASATGAPASSWLVFAFFLILLWGSRRTRRQFIRVRIQRARQNESRR